MPSREPYSTDRSFLESLSTQARFHLFLADFLKGRPRRDEIVPPCCDQTCPDTFRVSLRVAAEFLSKKDYTDNWVSEMNEEFCFWSFPEWRAALEDTGFSVLTREVPGERLSRSYCNPWIVEHRFEGRVRLSTTTGDPLPYPPTNMVLVAEKPRSA